MVVGEGDVRADEYIVLQADAVPKLNSAFNGNAVADYDIVFDEAMGAYQPRPERQKVPLAARRLKGCLRVDAYAVEDQC